MYARIVARNEARVYAKKLAMNLARKYPTKGRSN